MLNIENGSEGPAKTLEIFWIYKTDTAIICSLLSQGTGKKTSKNVIDILKEMSTKGKSREISLKSLLSLNCVHS